MCWRSILQLAYVGSLMEEWCVANMKTVPQRDDRYWRSLRLLSVTNCIQPNCFTIYLFNYISHLFVDLSIVNKQKYDTVYCEHQSRILEFSDKYFQASSRFMQAAYQHTSASWLCFSSACAVKRLRTRLQHAYGTAVEAFWCKNVHYRYDYVIIMIYKQISFSFTSVQKQRITVHNA